MNKLAVVVNFSSNEYAFLGACLGAALQVADQVIVSVCDHFFDGVPENRAILETAYLEHPECLFVEYPFDLSKNAYAKHPVSFWHNWGRLLGATHADPSIEHLLFLDVDEIIDVPAFSSWYAEEEHLVAEWLYSFWYFRTPTFRSRRWEENALLVRKDALASTHLMHHLERAGTYFDLPGEKRRQVSGTHGLPMIHHYSWVRSKEQMLRKVAAWGHRDDYPWQELVKKEFSNPFSGKDFVYGIECDIVPSLVHLKEPSFLSGIPHNVRRLSTADMHHLEREFL